MFYKLNAPSERTYQYAYKDQAFTGFQESECEECGRIIAVPAYDGPHCLIAEGGAKYPDYLAFCGAGEPRFILSRRAASVFQVNGMTGLDAFTPVDVMRERGLIFLDRQENALHAATNPNCGKVDLEQSEVMRVLRAAADQ